MKDRDLEYAKKVAEIDLFKRDATKVRNQRTDWIYFWLAFIFGILSVLGLAIQQYPLLTSLSIILYLIGFLLFTEGCFLRDVLYSDINTTSKFSGLAKVIESTSNAGKLGRTIILLFIALLMAFTIAILWRNLMDKINPIQNQTLESPITSKYMT